MANDRNEVPWGPLNKVPEQFPVYKCGDKPEKWDGLKKNEFELKNSRYRNMLCSDGFTQ
jgi:hypothetical protein